MEGVEIVITPKTVERIIYSTVIVILLVLVIINWGSKSCGVPDNKTTANAVAATQGTVETNTTPPINTSKLADTCSNTAKDASETDIDCGGVCGGCVEYKACNVDKDCADGLYCYQHIKCMKATCQDEVKNQDETNIDCGGVCGGFWWKADSKCHDTKEPSGKLEVSLSVDAGKSSLSSSAVLNSLTMTINNGLTSAVSLKAYIYALNANGGAVFQDQEGNNIAITTVSLPTVQSNDKTTKIVDLSSVTRRTLPGVKSTDSYQILVQFKDENNKLIDSATWTNS
jgi:hypothetical protein